MEDWVILRGDWRNVLAYSNLVQTPPTFFKPRTNQLEKRGEGNEGLRHMHNSTALQASNIEVRKIVLGLF